MELVTGALSAVFFGVIMAVIKTMEWLIKRWGGKAGGDKPVPESAGSRLSESVVEMKENIGFLRERSGDAAEERRAMLEILGELRGKHDSVSAQLETLAERTERMERLIERAERLMGAMAQED
jgi:hypothetical protein